MEQLVTYTNVSFKWVSDRFKTVSLSYITSYTLLVTFWWWSCRSCACMQVLHVLHVQLLRLIPYNAMYSWTTKVQNTCRETPLIIKAVYCHLGLASCVWHSWVIELGMRLHGFLCLLLKTCMFITWHIVRIPKRRVEAAWYTNAGTTNSMSMA